MIDHYERIKHVVRDALKQAAMGEPFGMVLSPPAIWPHLDAQGKVLGPGAAWFIIVSIRDDSEIGAPDLSDGYIVSGFLPKDDHFREVATAILEKLRQERERRRAAMVQQAKAVASLDAQRREAQSGSGLAVASKGQSK